MRALADLQVAGCVILMAVAAAVECASFGDAFEQSSSDRLVGEQHRAPQQLTLQL